MKETEKCARCAECFGVINADLRHNCNVIHIDFQKTHHPANTTHEDI